MSFSFAPSSAPSATPQSFAWPTTTSTTTSSSSVVAVLPPTTVITLDVGGTIFRTTLSTLHQIPLYATYDPSSSQQAQQPQQPSFIQQPSQAPPQQQPSWPRTSAPVVPFGFNPQSVPSARTGTDYSGAVFGANTASTAPMMGFGAAPSTSAPSIGGFGAPLSSSTSTSTSTSTTTTAPASSSLFASPAATNHYKLFIDRDPDLFKHILNYVRSKRNMDYIPLATSDLTLLKQLASEAQYFGLIDLSSALYTHIQQKQPLSSVSPSAPPVASGGFPVFGTVVKSEVTTKLLQVSAFQSNAMILKHDVSRNVFVEIPHTTIEFEVKDECPVMLQWYFGDCAGEFAVSVDSVTLNLQPAVTGMHFKGQTTGTYEYTHNAFVKMITRVSPGKHTAKLLWRSYNNTPYNIQGPVYAESWQLDPSTCKISQ